MAFDFAGWTTKEDETIAGHTLTVVTAADGAADTISATLADIVLNHYAAPERLAGILERLGKEKAANFLRTKLPTTKIARSADLGEILSTEFIDSETPYSVPIKRLRWKDHRNVAMRGEDVIGILPPDDDRPVRFLKAETKSRAALNTSTVSQARLALNTNAGLPSPHALAFVADRLHESGNEELGDLIDEVQLNARITAQQVENLLFTFSGNSPKAFLEHDLTGYSGDLAQRAVGLCVPQHQNFIAAVYGLLEGDNDT